MHPSFATRMESLSGSAIREILKMTENPEIISFAGGLPNARSFPAATIAELCGRLITQQGAKILQYGVTEGWAPLRESVIEVIKPRGIACGMENVLILTGSSQGIELFTKVMINPGDVILCESPTFLGALQIFASYQANVIGVEMENDGVNIEKLEQAMAQHKPKFFYTIPTFHNPTGCTMSAQKRRQIADLANRYDTFVLEDDPYGSLRYYGKALPAVASFDTQGRVVHLISFSKTVSPGLRVGAAIAKPDILRAMVVNKQGADTHTSNLSQAVVDAYIREGHYFSHIEEILPPYRIQLKTMMDAFEYFPQDAKHTSPEGGLFVWCELPQGIDAKELAFKAVQRKVAYVPGTFFYPEGGHLNTIRLNFSASEPTRIEEGMQRLGELFCEQIQFQNGRR